MQREGKDLLSKLVSVDQLYDSLLESSSPANIFRLARVSRAHQASVQSFIPRAFNINRHLERYFPDALAFRSLQARTGALVSGSSALQFFNRQIYADSDLDIYVSLKRSREVCEWVMEQGFRYLSKAGQLTTFDTAFSQMMSHHLDLDLEYNLHGISSVFTFVKPKRRGSRNDTQVQVVVATRTPMQVVLKFHSSMLPSPSPCLTDL